MSSLSAGWNEPSARAVVGTARLDIATAIGWFVAYLAAGSAVLLLQREAGASFWYPPVTLGILIVSLYGWRAGVIVVIADSIISSFQFGTPLAGVVVGTSTLLEAGLAAALLARAGVDLRLPDVRNLVRLFVLGAVVPTLVGVTHGSLWLLALGVTDPAAAFFTWLTWWLGDAVTATCLLPMLLIIAVPRIVPAQRRDRPGSLDPPPRQVVALALSAITLCVLAFGWSAGDPEHIAQSLKYLCFLPVIWAAITLGVPVTSGMVALVSTLAVMLSLFNGSPVGLVSLDDAPAVLNIQLFMLALGFGSMALALALEGERAARASSQRDAAALRASEGRLRQVLEEMPVMLDAFDADGQIIVWNREAERATGYSAAEIVGNPRAMELLYPARPYREEMVTEWKRRGNNYRGWIWEIAHKDGSRRTIAWSNISGRVPVEGWASWGIGVDITELRRAEDALRERETRLLQIAETVREVFWIRDMPSGRIGYVSPMYEAIWGRSCASLYAEPESMLAAVHPDDHARVAAAMAGKAMGRTFDERYRVVRPDGSLRWVWGRAFPIFDEQGSIYRIVGVAEDITEQQAIDEELRAARALLASVVEHVPASVFVCDLDDMFQLVNRSWERYFGRQRDEVLGRPVKEVLPPAMVEDFLTSNHQVVAQDVAIVFDRPLRHEGRETVFQVIKFPIRLGDGQISGVGGVALDITDRVRAEQSRRLLSAAQEQAGEGTLITDAAGTIITVNPAFERMSGYSATELVGRSPKVLQSGQHDAAFYRQLWATLRAGEVWRGRFVNRARGGRLYTVEATIAPIRGASGVIEHFVAVERDVTRELRLEEQFRQAQKMEAIGRLAGGIAHDFNNLLSVINGYSDLILDAHPDPDDPLHQDVEPIREAGQRAAGLTRQLLVFSRHQTLRPELLDLNRVLAETEKLLRRLIGEDIEVVTYQAPQLWPIYADRGQLEQVIMNLVVNARDAMPGGGTLRLATSNVQPDPATGEPGEYVRLEVSDTGVGMSDEVLSHLFEPFFTTKETGHGTGLGLAIVHGIVTKSGGTVSVSSVLGRGTRFTIDLPSHPIPAPDPPVTAQSREPLAPGTETILLVEDEAPIRTLLARVLRAQGYTVLSAANGAEALEHCAGPASIQLLLTDVVMPEMNGPELAAAARRRRPDLAVLYMSGYPDRGPDTGQPWPVEAPLLAKPLTPAALASAVRAALDRRAGTS